MELYTKPHRDLCALLYALGIKSAKPFDYLTLNEMFKSIYGNLASINNSLKHTNSIMKIKGPKDEA